MGELIHVLGGGAWQVPTVQRCRELGFRVLVTDPNLNRPAIAFADIHEAVDITNADATLEVSRRHGIVGILCDTTDWGVHTAAFVAEALALPGIGVDAALNVTNKARMRRLTKAAGLHSPSFAVISRTDKLRDAAAVIGLPLVAKPVDNQSGHGVGIVTAWPELEPTVGAALQASRHGLVLIEQMLQGVEVIVDGFVVDGACQVLGMARKTPYADNPTVCSQILYCEDHELPAPFEAIREACQRTVAALGVGQGIIHAEFIVYGDSVTPIDVAARGGGVLIYRVVIPHVSGVDANRAVIEQCAGLNPVVSPHARRRCACIEFFRLPPGRLDAWHGADEARSMPGIAALMLNAMSGDMVGTLGNKDQRPGYLVSLGDTSAEVLGAVAAAKARLSASMDGHLERVPVI